MSEQNHTAWEEPSDQRRRALGAKWTMVVNVLGAALALFHLYTALFGSLQTFTQRGLHLLATLLIAFFVYKPRLKGQSESIPWYDWLLIAGGILSYGYMIVNSNDLFNRIPYVTDLSALQIVMGVLGIIVLLEATRRAVGLALMIIALASIGYGLYGNLPGLLAHKDFGVTWVVDHLFFTSSGIFGVALGVSATFIAIFLVFGAFLEKSGAGQFFIDLSIAAMGKYRGGPAKTAVLASGLMGTISGSAAANTVTTGAFTIPLMKRIGYKPEFAAAVEAVASTGGQIMPPIMGSAAFLIAEYVGVSYFEVALAALIPALLYYLCVYFQVDFRAGKMGLRGLKRDELPVAKKVLRQGFLFFIPLVLIVLLMLMGYSPMRAGLISLVSVVVICMFRAATRMSMKSIMAALISGGKGMTEIAIACATAGIVTGIITLTGIGLRFNGIILELAGGSLFLVLFFTMLTSIVLGMGLPTVAAYIVQVSLTAPALIEMGVPPIAAHMFIFYFAIISAITPPVALAAYAGAGIAGSNPMKTGIAAMKLGIAAFIVPYMFVYGPSLLLIGEPLTVAGSAFTALVGVYAMSAALEGFFFRTTRVWERIGLFIAAFTLIKPGLITDLAGFSILVILFLSQTYWNRSASLEGGVVKKEARHG